MNNPEYYKGDRAKRICASKIRYSNQPEELENGRPYFCPICEGWHMTSRMPKIRAKDRYAARQLIELGRY